MMRSWHGHGLCGPGSFFGGPWGWLIHLAFWLAVILLAVWLVRTLLERPGGRRAPDSSPLEILSHRYAAGEIDREAFERMKRELAP